MQTTVTREVLADGEYLEVEMLCDMSTYNNGIGAFERHGTCGYDAGVQCAALERVTWDRGEFTDGQNEQIKQYVDRTWSALETEAEEKLFS